MWRFRGTPHYLNEQARRLGITQVLADRARNNPEIYRCAVLLAQLCERYHSTRQEGGKPAFGFAEKNQIKGTLGQVELELQKLHMLAATAVTSEFDPPHTLPLGDGTVGVPDDSTVLIAGDTFDRAIAESG